jgi:hypothetical protein
MLLIQRKQECLTHGFVEMQIDIHYAGVSTFSPDVPVEERGFPRNPAWEMKYTVI